MSTFARYQTILKQKIIETSPEFEGYLSDRDILSACQAESQVWRERFWTPLQTFWAFLIQVLSPNCSCRKAVAKVLAGRVAEGRPAKASADASAYAQARHRRPEGVVRRCFQQVGRTLSAQAGSALLWFGRRVWLVDGSTSSMPDTPENQAAFGQPSVQKKGCGFPIAKLVGLFCWSTGALVDLAIGPLRRSEILLWRTLWENLKAGDVVLADRFYCIYGDLTQLVSRGVDFVVRLSGPRTHTVDFRKGTRLGKADRLITFLRPAQCPRAVSEAEWLSWPLTLTTRLIRVLMWQAARTHHAALRRLSFAGTVQRLNALTPYLNLFRGTAATETLYRSLLEWIAHDRLPDRPNRIEPRAVKRRPKEYAWLNKPRSEMRRELLG